MCAGIQGGLEQEELASPCLKEVLVRGGRVSSDFFQTGAHYPGGETKAVEEPKLSLGG